MDGSYGEQHHRPTPGRQDAAFQEPAVPRDESPASGARCRGGGVVTDPDVPTNPMPVSVTSDGPPPPGQRSDAAGSAALRAEIAEVSRLRGLLTLEESTQSALQVVVEAAREALDHVAEASVCVRQEQGMATVAWTGLLAQELDAVQFLLREGPGLDAALGGVPISTPNLRAEQRWPGFIRRALEKGALSALAVPVPPRPRAPGALTLYSTRVSGLDARARRVAVEYAGLASEVLERARAREGEGRDPAG
jgi:hypothetical protein